MRTNHIPTQKTLKGGALHEKENEAKATEAKAVELIHIISLGAGVQSSTMALMAACGEITPMPKFAVFADTGDEPDAVYEWLTELRGLLPFPVKIARRRMKGVQEPKLSDFIVEYGHTQIPSFVSNNEGRPALGKRQCTKHWKIMPIMRAIREEMGTVGKRMKAGGIIQWIGISLEEVHRMKPSRNDWQLHRWPLIEKRMRRWDCVLWLKRHGYKVPPKSACVYCPYQDRSRWRDATRKPIDGREWQTIERVQRAVRGNGEYLTKDLLPLSEVDFSNAEDRGQVSLFGNECEGMCGV